MGNRLGSGFSGLDPLKMRYARGFGFPEGFQPMEPVAIDSLGQLPQTERSALWYARVKVPGIRALVSDGVVYRADLKPIPNKQVQRMFGHHHGFDGELAIWHNLSANYLFEATADFVMSENAEEPELWYLVSDLWNWPLGTAEQRGGWKAPSTGMQVVPCEYCFGTEDILWAGAKIQGLGLKALILKKANSLYQHGKSTLEQASMIEIDIRKMLEAENGKTS